MSSASRIQSPPTDFLQRPVVSRYFSVAASSLHLLLILCQGCFQAFTVPHSPFVEVSRTRVTTKAATSPRAAFQSGDSERKRCSTAPRMEMEKPQWKAAFNVLSRCVWVPSKCSFFRDIGRGPQSDSQACSNVLCPFLFFVQRGPTQRRMAGNLWLWSSEPLLSPVGPNDPPSFTTRELTSRRWGDSLVCVVTGGVWGWCRVQAFFYSSLQQNSITQVHGAWYYCF